MRLGLLCASLALLTASGLAAQSMIAIEREVFLETVEMREGRKVRALEPADELRRGDTVVLMLAWRSPSDEPFTLSSRVPRALAFRNSGGDAPEVSVDGGENWGTLDQLRVNGRPATSADVTHVRWDVDNPGATRRRGVFTYSAVVR